MLLPAMDQRKILGMHDAERPILADDDVLADVIRWHDLGRRTVMVTLIEIDGATPRPLGAQMAVAEDGSTAGYLSGGCLEEAVALEALRILKSGHPRVIRYGRGSPYFDVKLPCGSGLDLCFHPVDRSFVEQARQLRQSRTAFLQVLDLETGHTSVAVAPGVPLSRRTGSVFHRAHIPPLRVQIVGGGPVLIAVAGLIRALGAGMDIITPDEKGLRELWRADFPARGMADPRALALDRLDPYTAAIVAFHDHDWEAPVLAEILISPCFYIGVIGSRQAHHDRLAKLSAMGVPSSQFARLRNPAGLIARAKSRGTLAVSILAELVSEAKSAGILA
jgi:xanthine dehydrogenase accessory factor